MAPRLARRAAPLALALWAVAASRAPAVPNCGDAAALLTAQREALGAFIKTDRCVFPTALSEFRLLFPEGFPASQIALLKAAVLPDGTVRDPGKLVAPEPKRGGKKKGKKAPAPAEEAAAAAAGEERAPLDEETLTLAAFVVRSALERGLIKIQCGSTTGSSAYWSHDPNCGSDKAVCGEMVVNADKLGVLNGAIASGSEASLRLQDQLSNSLIHETSHIFVSLFRNLFGVESAMSAGKAPKKWSYPSYWNGCKPGDFDPSRRTEILGYELDWIGYTECTTCNEMAGRKIAHRIHYCGKDRTGKILGLSAGSTCSTPKPLGVNIGSIRF